MARHRRVYYEGRMDSYWFVPRLNDWIDDPGSTKYQYQNYMYFKTFKKALSAMRRWPKIWIDKTRIVGCKRYFVGSFKPID